MFATIGSVSEIAEQQFSMFSVIGGASVAFAYFVYRCFYQEQH